MVLESVIFPELALFDGNMSIILDDYSRVHSLKVVKEYVN